MFLQNLSDSRQIRILPRDILLNFSISSSSKYKRDIKKHKNFIYVSGNTCMGILPQVKKVLW